MSAEIEQIRRELGDLGYDTSVRHWDHGTVVELDYKVETGTRNGETVRLGISFHDGRTGYPEYPPHWIHVSPPASDGQKVHYHYTTEDGREWAAMSRPPKDIWDRLPVKDMKNYLNEHMRRFWNGI